MKLKALKKAVGRLNRAAEALEKLTGYESYDDFSNAWTDFITSLNDVFVFLGEGSKGHNLSQSWFARKKGERKSDELLQYLYQARNAEQHGIEEVVGEIFTRAEAVATEGMKVFSVSIGYADGQIAHIIPPEGRDVLSQHVTVDRLVGIALVPVTDGRSKQTYQPPKLHLGHSIIGKSISEIATLAHAYYYKMVEEAETLAAARSDNI